MSLDNRAILDALEIYHSRERRDLPAAVRFYLDREHDEAHSAAADVLAAAEILDAQLGQYPDLPRTVVELHGQFVPADAVDMGGVFMRHEGEVRFAIGKYRGQPLKIVAVSAPDYLKWMLGEDFFEDAKDLVRRALGKAA